jgi:cell division protein FtsQ
MLGAIWNDDKLMGIIAGLFFALATVLLGYASVQWLINRPVFALKRVELKGEVERVNPIGFKTNVLSQIKGSFFSADLHQVRKLVEQQPWVRKATVQRAWPDGLKVDIEEHKVLAKWGDSRLVNTFGEVFSANIAEVSNEAEMAVLSGPLGSELLVSTMYVDSLKHLGKLGMHTVKLRLSDRYSWTLETNQNLRVELGRDQDDFPVQRKFDRLLSVYPKIQSEIMPRVVGIDLRNPRGVAIQGEREVATKKRKATGARFN